MFSKTRIVTFKIASELFFFFFNDTATTEIYTLSLHDALPISINQRNGRTPYSQQFTLSIQRQLPRGRSEEHTSELQSPCNLVCRLLLEKKKTHFVQRRHSAHSKKFEMHAYCRRNLRRSDDLSH